MVRAIRRLSARVTTALLVSSAFVFAPGVPIAQAGAENTYVVLYGSQAVPAGAAKHIQAAGGSMIAAYPEIGVAIARSASNSFTAQVKSDNKVAGVSATSGFGTQLKKSEPDAAGSTETGDFPSLKDRQWDMAQINAFAAQEVTSGSRSVLVGDIDTGLDFTHPNLSRNVDFKNSVSCIGGTPNTSPAAWMDDNGHGTHTAGTIAAGGMEGGMNGVAPNVRIAGIKAGDANGYFFPEAVVCSFMWAGRHHMDMTNNSYFADPWLYNCLNDPGQRAIWQAETRAIKFAMGRGVTVVAAAGNENDDLGNPTVDNLSPDFPAGVNVTRKVDKNCFVVPAMVPGVYTVSGVGNLNLKSFFSSYGMPWVQATAPSGDSVFQKTTAAPNGRVLSTIPAALVGGYSRVVKICGEDGQCATYAYLQGTSMASPHVAGVAALIASRFGHQSPRSMTRLLNQATDQLTCPADPFNPGFFGPDGVHLAHCSGSPAYNSFYGYGQINALKAVLEGEANNQN
jgi:lantibiotic leader peptide-processing serine protease